MGVSYPQQPLPHRPPMPQPNNVYGPRSTSSTFSGWGGAPAMPPRPGLYPPAGLPQPAGYSAPQGGFGPPRGPAFGSAGGPGFAAPPFQAQGLPQRSAPPGGFGPPYGGPAWQQQPRPRRPLGLLTAIGLSAMGLVGLLVVAVLGSPADDIAADYQNEDYRIPSSEDRVPRVPIPKNEEEATAWTQNNALYEQQLAAPVRCEQRLRDDVHSLDAKGLEEHLQAFTTCLTRVWGPTLQAAGFTDYLPEVTVFPAGSRVTTGCGTQESMNAFYCPRDQKIYLAPDIVKVLPDESANHRSVFELILAHEYGHAMQGRSGIATASAGLQVNAPSEQAGLEFSRRSEVQADCFAGEVLNSLSKSLAVTDADRRALGQISYEIGDDQLAQRFNAKGTPAHGTGANRKLWIERGLGNRNLGQCNTFTAPEAEVE